MVSRMRIVNVIRAVNVLVLTNTGVVSLIRCISKWPAVILAVSRTASATGWMNRLIVLIITSIGMRKVGVPCGKKWARDAFVFLRRPVMTALAHRGVAIPTLTGSCVVGIDEWGNSPRRLVEPITRTSDISISDQVCPL